MRADLHIHTYYSDGALSPAEVVAEANKNGVELIAVTDHDCMPACKELPALCSAAGINFVNGLEVSAYLGGVKIHTLGYNVNVENPDFENFLKELRLGSYKRGEDIINKLNSNGVKITLEEVTSRLKSPLSPVHTMHFAFACAAKGYCGGNPFEFFKNYLAWGKCGFSDICRPSPFEAVEIISAAGGFSSLAHPARIDMPQSDLIKLIENMKACGLGGIEAVYTTHTVTETAYYKETAKTFSLEVTGGSDVHRIGGSREIGRPVFRAEGVLAKKLGF